MSEWEVGHGVTIYQCSVRQTQREDHTIYMYSTSYHFILGQRSMSNFVIIRPTNEYNPKQIERNDQL